MEIVEGVDLLEIFEKIFRFPQPFLGQDRDVPCLKLSGGENLQNRLRAMKIQFFAKLFESIWRKDYACRIRIMRFFYRKEKSQSCEMRFFVAKENIYFNFS